MDAYINVQLDLQNRILKARTNFKKSSKDRLSSSEYLTTRIELLEELWTQFNMTHTQIVQDSDSKELAVSQYVVKDVYGVTEETFIEYKCEIRSAMSKLNLKMPATKNESGASSSKSNDHIKLPKISIPIFAGKYSEWISFRDLFVSLIHNNASLDKVQKLQYLKGHLTGEAEKLLRHIQISHDNYDICWRKLEERYDNKRYLSNCILKRFFSQRSITSESATALKELLDTTNECLDALKNLGIDISTWDIIVIHILCLKLDDETRKQWELKVSESSDDLPTLKQFQDFLAKRFRGLEFIDPKLSKNNVHFKPPIVSAPKVHHSTYSLSCAFCSENHKICNCKAFVKMDTDDRRSFTQSNNLCFNCLGSGHSVFSCRQSSRCRICKRKHHSLLHPKNITSSADSATNANPSAEQNVAAHVATSHPQSSIADESPEIQNYFSSSHGQVILATALVKAQSNSGTGTTVRCLLDQGSQASFITESAVQLLGLKKIPHQSKISGLGSDEGASLASKSMVKFQIQSLQDSDFVLDMHAFVMSKLTSVLPERKIVIEFWSEFKNINLADPSFDTPGKIDILLGADVYGRVLMDGIIKGPQGSLIAQKTALGWILSGPIHSNTSTIPQLISTNHIRHFDENELLKKFWELEADIVSVDPRDHYTDEEKQCESIYTATTKRNSTGRYIVKLPFRNLNPECKNGNFEAIAIKRFGFLERRFIKDPSLKARYSEVIAEYLKLGHMEIVPVEDRNKKEVVYLPHHAVIREDKTTSKLRVVFDASCPGENGVSLNQDLLVGPTLQSDLRHILLRWRCHPICLVADIIKMYRQVVVDRADTDFQRILWRDEPDQPLQHMRLLRVTFGTASAPYLAVRTLHQVAYDEGKDFPLAAEKILKDFYMDDLLSGCESVEEGKQIYKELNQLLERAGFELQKWSSNNDELLQAIGQGQPVEETLPIRMDTVMKILGLTWNRSTDEFEYSVQLPPLKIPVTKRSVISDISRLFDPLGWLAPVIITAKIFIQKLWLSGIEWDDEVPSQLLSEWLSYRSKLNDITKFSLPRWIHTNSHIEIRELQGFCDASSEAYAAVVYLRTVNEDGIAKVSLITSKTKVSPIKQISIPRLELCGAVLLTKLLMEVAAILNIHKANIHAWTDSSIVLSWLNSRPNRWKTFVANRVAEIITSTDPHQWSHVSSKDNPADCASRGTHQINDERLWKEGPEWLKEEHICYKRIINETNLEEKINKACFTTTYTGNHDIDDEFMAKFSSLRKLVRVVAFCKRFMLRTQKKITEKWLTSEEIRKALITCIKLVQNKYFEDELKDIIKQKMVNKKSKLTSLNPFIDDEGILRVGGRLQHAQMSEQMKHPIIVPQKSHLTNLIVADAHSKTLHGGPQVMLYYLRSKYWIVGAKNLVKMFVRKCVICTRYSAPTRHPLMGQLPSTRGEVARPFYRSGVDYAGPINIRTSKGRGHHSYKGYICLFICMATRAIHLEVVSDLTSQGFLAAFKRFVARRGHCSDIWSDNGTNFVGAARELKQLFSQESSGIITEIADCLATNGTTWHFIPAHAPNFGGLWEAGIKSTKNHLKRVIGNSTLTFEEMATVLSQIEACLNSRPISKISDNSEDSMPLTPGHFLIGEPLVLAPDYSYEKSTISNLRRYQLTQRMVQDFWRRWSSEYLTQFYHRYKWFRQDPEPAIGDIVLVKEDDLPPARWLYGVVVQKHPGLDGITRVVSLRCKNNVIKRPVTKLCFLPVEK